jgi:hypothetical protein
MAIARISSENSDKELFIVLKGSSVKPETINRMLDALTDENSLEHYRALKLESGESDLDIEKVSVLPEGAIVLKTVTASAVPVQGSDPFVLLRRASRVAEGELKARIDQILADTQRAQDLAAIRAKRAILDAQEAALLGADEADTDEDDAADDNGSGESWIMRQARLKREAATAS